MIYDPRKKKTYFWFSNYSNIPARVSVEALIIFADNKNPHEISYEIPPPENTNGKSVPPNGYRIPPQTKDKPTAPDYFDRESYDSDRYHKEDVKAIILVKVKPDIEDVPSSAETRFKKFYKFHTNKWDEMPWGDSDTQSAAYNNYYYG